MQLIGESRQKVIIQYAEARDNWRCSQPDDYGAGVVNIQGSDISFENLTVINPYGFEATGDKTIPCLTDAGKDIVSTVQKYALPREKGEVEGMKIVRKDGHQFAIRSMPGATRLKFIHCTFRSGGGDTVSPWDVATGLYYFKDCEIEGGVDLYCPRGYALAENCTFICHNLSAAIWHDGSQEEQAKTVLSHCTFKGDPGFKLGRYHREAQMFLFDCQFANEMADAPIYQASDRKLTWGHRIFITIATARQAILPGSKPTHPSPISKTYSNGYSKISGNKWPLCFIVSNLYIKLGHYLKTQSVDEA